MQVASGIIIAMSTLAAGRWGITLAEEGRWLFALPVLFVALVLGIGLIFAGIPTGH